MRVGVIGGGQLARMMIPPAVALGIELRVLAEADGSSAALAVTSIGDHRDTATVLAFAREVDVVTFDHEHVPPDVLAALVDAGVTLRPGPEPLAAAQDKVHMRERLSGLGVPVPDWAAVHGPDEVAAFLADHGGTAVVKTPRGGYDGKGVRVVTDPSDVDDWWSAVPDGVLLAEALVPFRRELAQQVARRPGGEAVAWPLVETVQRDGVCAEVTAPAPGSEHLGASAEAIARTVADGLGVTGALAVELFETDAGDLLVNELAMRPHNSGHWTIDGAVTDQFEQHLRAVLDLPLGAPDPVAPWSVMVNVLGGPSDATMPDRYVEVMDAHPDAHLHCYAKTSRPGRKVGHVTVVGAELDAVAATARAAAARFSG